VQTQWVELEAQAPVKAQEHLQKGWQGKQNGAA
jgi:hypothetical protein